MKKLLVCSLNQVHDTAKKHNATHVLSCLSPIERLFVTPRLAELTIKRIVFEDVFDPDEPWAPTPEAVEEGLAFARDLPEDAVLIVHCQAGISRSTAMALAILMMKRGNLEAAVDELVEVRPCAAPNPLISSYADKLLGMDGKLEQAAEDIFLNSESGEILKRLGLIKNMR